MGSRRVAAVAAIAFVAACKREAKVTPELVAAASALEALPASARGDVHFEPAIADDKSYAFLAPVAWVRDDAGAFHSPASLALPVTYTVSHACPTDGCTLRSDAEWHAYFGALFEDRGGTGSGARVEVAEPGKVVASSGFGVSTRDGSGGHERYLVARWKAGESTDRPVQCVVEIDFTGEDRRSPKRELLALFAQACRALSPAF